MRLGSRHILNSILPILAVGVTGIVVSAQMIVDQRSHLEESIHHEAELIAASLDQVIKKVAALSDQLAHRNLSLASAVSSIQTNPALDFFTQYVSDVRLKTMISDRNNIVEYRSWDPNAASTSAPTEHQGIFSGRIVTIAGKPHFAISSPMYSNDVHGDPKGLGQLFMAFPLNDDFLMSLRFRSSDIIHIGLGSEAIAGSGALDERMLSSRAASKVLPTLWIELSKDLSSIEKTAQLNIAFMALAVLLLSGAAFIYQWKSTSREIIEPIEKIHSVIIEGAPIETLTALPKNDLGDLGVALLNQKVDLEQKVLVIRSITDQFQRDASLLKVLSHDIATPLTIVKAISGMLIKKSSAHDPGDLDLLHRLSTQVTTIEQILGHVRDMKALESGKRRLDLHEISFGAVMTEVQEAFQDRLAAKGVTLIWNKADDDLTFVADKISFKVSVLSNLISNAIKFSARDGRIDVSCRVIDGTTRIEVRDYGQGIPVSIRSHLFSANHATNRLGSEGESGTGFGMPLVKFYIDLYGGKIGFETKLKSDSLTDHGTTFHILLPTKLSAAITSAAA